ncbi:hypothetical protein C8R44DRAFT_141600 [Mycena epipterygia]|nr:hypothetical protein C8R44DRAFT_141600 [Mycena epipterygia]
MYLSLPLVVRSPSFARSFPSFACPRSLSIFLHPSVRPPIHKVHPSSSHIHTSRARSAPSLSPYHRSLPPCPYLYLSWTRRVSHPSSCVHTPDFPLPASRPLLFRTSHFLFPAYRSSSLYFALYLWGPCSLSPPVSSLGFLVLIGFFRSRSRSGCQLMQDAPHLPSGAKTICPGCQHDARRTKMRGEMIDLAATLMRVGRKLTVRRLDVQVARAAG